MRSLDPFTLTVFTIAISFLMGLGLFALSRSYFREIKGIRHWASALLLISIGCILMSLSGVIADFVSMVVGTSLLILGAVVYYHALLIFKEIQKPMQWWYVFAVVLFIGNVYFVLINFNLNAKIVVTSSGVAILLLASAHLLFKKHQGISFISHRLTAIFFSFGVLIYGTRAVYYAFWHDHPESTLLHVNIIQSISYFLIPMTVITTSFGFALMCIEKYLNEKNRAQAVQQEFSERLQKITTRLPGVVYQYLLNPDGSSCFPYSSSAMETIYRLKPEEVKQSADKILSILHPDDRDKVLESILNSAKTLTPWQLEYRVSFNDGVERWLYGNAIPQQEENGAVLWHGFINDITERKKMELDLYESRAKYKTLIDDLGGKFVIYSHDLAGKVLFVSDSIENVMGVPKEKALGHVWTNIFDWLPGDIERACQYHRLLIESDINFIQFEVGFHHRNGSIHTIQVSAHPTRDTNGQVVSIEGIVEDITERKQAEMELRISAAIFQSNEGMMITDVKGNIIKVNHAFTKITGYSETEVIGKNPRILNSGKQNQDFYTKLWQVIYEKGAWEGELWNRRKDGTIYPERLTITAVKGYGNDQITHYVAIFSDITERKATEEYINRLAFYDPLTQLPNRRLLNERVKHSIEVCHRMGTQVALLMMDLDKFKAVNDTLGHIAGDELLQQVAERIKAVLREMDTVARLGGDEFVVLLEEITHIEAINHVADRIIDTLKKPFILNQQHEALIGTSIGIAMYPNHGDTIEVLIDKADKALYQAKARGRCCFVYYVDEEIEFDNKS